MSRDLYGELLSRALQRSAPAGHIPAYITPGEGRLLRSHGGGVAPGGGQYMANGIPTFYDAAGGGMEGEDTGVGEPGDPGGAYGGADMGDPEGTGVGTGVSGEPGAPGGGYGGVFGWEDAIAAGMSGLSGVYGGPPSSDHGPAAGFLSNEAQAAIGRALAAQTAQEEAAAAAAAAAAQAQAQAQAQISLAAFEATQAAEQAQAQAAAQALADVEGLPSSVTAAVNSLADTSDLDVESPVEAPAAAPSQAVGPTPSGRTNTTEGWANNAVAAPTSEFSGSNFGLSFAEDTQDVQSDLAEFTSDLNTQSFAPPEPDYGYGYLDTLGPPQSESTGMGTAPGSTSGPDGQALAQATLVAQAMAAALSIESFGNPDQSAAAVEATGQDPTAGNVTNAGPEGFGHLTAQGLESVDQDIGVNDIAQGRFSPAASWGSRSETAQANIEAGRSTGVTVGMMNALNAQDHTGYAINNPQPTSASVVASQVFAQLNPTITNAVIGLTGLMPGTIGFAGFLAGILEDRGLLSIPAIADIPGVQALRDVMNIPRDLVSEIGRAVNPFSNQTPGDLLSQGFDEALSLGQQAVADVLGGTGIFDSDETGFLDDSGDTDAAGDSPDGDAPEIVFTPTVEPPVDPPVARTFEEVEAATKNRILSNLRTGLRRLGRSTEGVTAFGPLFGSAETILPGPPMSPIVPEDGPRNPVAEIQPFPRDSFSGP